MQEIILCYILLCITPYCLWILVGMVTDALDKAGITYEQE